MTNNDKFFEVFGFHAYDEMNILPCTNECPYLKICKESVTGNCDSFGEDWWSAEYKEPSNSEIPIGSIIDWNDCHTSEQLESISTAKKDLAVGQDFITTLSEKVTETHDEFIFETIKSYCENVVNMKISKKDLEQALLQYYGKNDLAVNCIDRTKLLKIYEDRFIELEKIKHLKDNKGAEDRQLGVNYCINVLKEFPPVTLQEPRWISTSQRLPNIAGVYMVTRYYPNNIMNPNYLVDACFFDGSNTWYNDNRINHERGYVDNIIAWQENPEPYKVESQESGDKE